MEESYTLTWEEAGEVVESEEVICGIDNENMITETGEFEEVCEEVVVQSEEVVVPDDGVVYLAEDVIVMQNPQEITHELVQDTAYMDCVTEEVVADNWEEACNELVVGSEENIGIVEGEPGEEDVMIPLPTDQDQYSAMRPYPCDFCSRRFRKKANLMNHMVAHQTDKPHGCNLCGVRYVRKFDLMNHLKIHAYVPETDNLEEELVDEEFQSTRKRPKPGSGFMNSKKKKQPKMKVEEDDEQHHHGGNRLAGSSSRGYSYVNVGDASGTETRYPITDPRKPFVCQHCGVGFAREKALASHSRMHQGDSPFECRKCGEMFWDANLMRDHIKNKHDGIEDDFLDEDDEFSEDDNNSKYGEFFCPTCGMTFPRQDHLKRHQRIHIKSEYTNDNEHSHICNVCGESFPEALDLLAHAEVHARNTEFRCMLCGDTACDEQALAAHVQAKHGDDLPDNTCLHCGRTCKDRRTLLTHCLEHSKEKTFPCPKCAKTFHNKARLKRHMLSHRNKAVTCDVCGEDFPDGRSLMNHRHSHSSVSGRQFPCRECGKTFGSRSSQQIHIRIHTGERPYGCRFCWKAFADGGTLRKHERIHTGEKPYACAVCPRAFNQRVVLREHIRSHHSGPDPNFSHSMTPYCCAVCSDMFSTSQDLIVHLIHHCDLNTAMRRQPQIGPRKYKRRRKLKPHEIDLMSNVNANNYGGVEEEAENIDNEFFDSDEDTKTTPLKKKRKNSTTAATKSPDDGYTDMYNSLSSAIENINTIVNTKSTKPKKKGGKETLGGATPSRPKMIHTQKTKVSVESNDGGRLRHKTKTLITRTQPTEAKSGGGGDRIRPRTKNVSYHILNPDKLPLATFQDATEQAVNSLLELNPNTDHEEIINGADPIEDPLVSPPTKSSRRRRSTSSSASDLNTSLAPGRHIIGGGQVVKFVRSGMLVKKKVKIEVADPDPEPEEDPLAHEFVRVKQEVIENPLNEFAELSMQHAQNIFKCEMCSATFSDRAQLLLHVPIHI